MENTNLVAIFTTGLLTGGLTCMAVQGGLLAATLAQREEERLKEKLQKGGNALPIVSFLIAKLIAYTLLGGLLGWLGSFFQLSITAQVILQIAVAVFMIGTALSLLNVHPFFRYFVIQPPRFLTRFVRKQSKRGDIFAPATLGALTIFIPCGTTQAMMALAIGTGSSLLGATILFVFVLGTSPVFFTLGYLATHLSGFFQTKFMRFAAFAIIILALFNLNNAFSLAGFPTADRLINQAYCIFSICDNEALAAEQQQTPVTEATITMTNNGYSPLNLVVKAGSQITLHLRNTGANNCAQSFTIPKFNIQKVVPLGNEDTIAFTAPKEESQIPFMCGMGMYRGNIIVKS